VADGKRAASRAAARRNAKLTALRELVSQDRAILAADLASKRQAEVMCDHDSAVLARRMFTGSGWCTEHLLIRRELRLPPRSGLAVMTCAGTSHCLASLRHPKQRCPASPRPAACEACWTCRRWSLTWLSACWSVHRHPV
jgi:hypothetical protein